MSLTLFILFFLASVVAYVMQRKIYALRNYVKAAPSLDDLTVLAIFSAVLASIGSIDSAALQTVVIFVWMLAIFLLWLDAVLLHLYGFEINISNIIIFFQGADSFSGESGALIRTFKKRHWFLALPVFMVTFPFMFIAIVGESELFAMAASVAVSSALFAAIKAKISIKVLPIWFGLMVLVTWLIPVVSGVLSVSLYVVCFVSVVLWLGNSFCKQLPGYFFSSVSALRYFLVGERLTPVKGQEVDERHKGLLHDGRHISAITDNFEQCKDANVILVTLESLSADFVSAYSEQGAAMPFFDSLKKTGIFSQRHYACSPNTNRAVEHIYYSDYPAHTSLDLFSSLKSKGYKTAYMMISKTKYFNLIDILKRLGFDYIWDQDSEGFDAKDGDYSFVKSVDKIADALGGGKFFLHLKSEQTHSPYHVVDKQRFSKFKGDDRESRYKNAIEESDSVIQSFIENLAERLDLSNTIIIYTGDHGQSFGQFGYSSHSNSTVRQQLIVPFVMSHPNIEAQSLNRTTHFDILPTVLDLLGEKQLLSYGQPMTAIEDRPLFCYSQTRKANAPSNMSLIISDQKIMLDLIYGYRYLLDEQDNIVRQLSAEEAQYYRHLFYHILMAKGLLSHSAFNPRPKTRPD